MKLLSIKKTDENLVINTELTTQELKMLYNACADIVNELPDMTGYKDLAGKLKAVISNTQSDKY